MPDKPVESPSWIPLQFCSEGEKEELWKDDPDSAIAIVDKMADSTITNCASSTLIRTGGRITLADLPEELLVLIFQLLPVWDVVKCSRVCKMLHQALKSHWLWAILEKRDFGPDAASLKARYINRYSPCRGSLTARGELWRTSRLVATKQWFPDDGTGLEVHIKQDGTILGRRPGTAQVTALHHLLPHASKVRRMVVQKSRALALTDKGILVDLKLDSSRPSFHLGRVTAFDMNNFFLFIARKTELLILRPRCQFPVKTTLPDTIQQVHASSHGDCVCVCQNGVVYALSRESVWQAPMTLAIIPAPTKVITCRNLRKIRSLPNYFFIHDDRGVVAFTYQGQSACTFIGGFATPETFEAITDHPSRTGQPTDVRLFATSCGQLFTSRWSSDLEGSKVKWQQPWSSPAGLPSNMHLLGCTRLQWDRTFELVWVKKD